MGDFWAKVRGIKTSPSREEVMAVQAREVAEATRQRLERAIKYRENEINGLVNGVIPKRGLER